MSQHDDEPDFDLEEAGTSEITTRPGERLLAPAPIMPSVPADGSTPVEPTEAPSAAPITEHEVGEYREQDRYLPVWFMLCVDCSRS